MFWTHHRGICHADASERADAAPLSLGRTPAARAGPPVDGLPRLRARADPGRAGHRPAPASRRAPGRGQVHPRHRRPAPARRGGRGSPDGSRPSWTVLGLLSNCCGAAAPGSCRHRGRAAVGAARTVAADQGLCRAGRGTTWFYSAMAELDAAFPRERTGPFGGRYATTSSSTALAPWPSSGRSAHPRPPVGSRSSTFPRRPRRHRSPGTARRHRRHLRPSRRLGGRPCPGRRRAAPRDLPGGPRDTADPARGAPQIGWPVFRLAQRVASVNGPGAPSGEA